MKKSKAQNEFEKLNKEERNFLIRFLMKIRMQYDASPVHVDLPYYFWSIHKYMFHNKKEKLDFLDINTGDEFATQSIYYISRQIISQRRI